jgi:hypothetical protein
VLQYRSHPALASSAGGSEPRPGDILVIGEKNDYTKGAHSHTTMVERYDADTATITTVEGNAGAAVRSQRLVLTNPKDAARIVHLMTYCSLPRAFTARSRRAGPVTENESPGRPGASHGGTVTQGS